MALTDDELGNFKEKLSSEKVQLEEDLKSLQETSKPVTLDQQAVGRVSRIDAIQQQQMQKSSLERTELRVKLLGEALKRIEEGDFGLCKICEEPISSERLKARPESPLCIGCVETK